MASLLRSDSVKPFRNSSNYRHKPEQEAVKALGLPEQSTGRRRAHLLDLFLETLLQVLVTPDQLVKNLLSSTEESAFPHRGAAELRRAWSRCVSYLSVCLHGLQVFLCREEAELGAGHVVGESPARGCRGGSSSLETCCQRRPSRDTLRSSPSIPPATRMSKSVSAYRR